MIYSPGKEQSFQICCVLALCWAQHQKTLYVSKSYVFIISAIKLQILYIVI